MKFLKQLLTGKTPLSVAAQQIERHKMALIFDQQNLKMAATQVRYREEVIAELKRTVAQWEQTR